MPVDRTQFEAVLTKSGLKQQFDARIPVAECFGGNEEETWCRNAKTFGWFPEWKETDGVKVPYGVVPEKSVPKPIGLPVPPEKVRDKRIKLNAVADRESLLRWTQAAIGTDPETIHEDDVPSTAHLSMLEFANSKPDIFWRWISESDARKEAGNESQKAFLDDQRRLFRVMDQVIEDRERTAKQQAETSA